MQQESMSLVEFQRRFVSDEACMEHLFRLRWPDGYTCPGVVIKDAVSTVRACCFSAVRVSIRSRLQQGRFSTRRGLLW